MHDVGFVVCYTQNHQPKLKDHTLKNSKHIKNKLSKNTKGGFFIFAPFIKFIVPFPAEIQNYLLSVIQGV